MKDYFDATIVSSNIQVKFLNFSCVTSCGRLTHSACIQHHSLSIAQTILAIVIRCQAYYNHRPGMIRQTENTNYQGH